MDLLKVRKAKLMIHNSRFIIQKTLLGIELGIIAIVGLLGMPHKSHAAVIIQRPLYVGLTSGLVGSWSFDGPDMNATKALDKSGQGNHGTLTNGPVRKAGKIGQALSFDGVDDYVDVSDPGTSPFDLTGTITVGAWIYPQTTVKGIIVGKKTDGAASGYYVRTFASELEFAWSDGVTTHIYTSTSDDPIATLKWQHTVFLGSSYAAINGVQHTGKRGERPQRLGLLLKGEGERKRLGIPLLGEVR
jgi:hypothetical protein